MSLRTVSEGIWSVTGSLLPRHFVGEASVIASMNIIAAQEEQLVLVGRLTPGGDVGVGATVAARKVLTK